MTSSNGNIFRVTGHLCGEFTGPGEVPTQRPVTRSFDVFFDLCLNKRLNKQPWGWWFETPSWSLWRQCNVAREGDSYSRHHMLISCNVNEWCHVVSYLNILYIYMWSRLTDTYIKQTILGTLVDISLWLIPWPLIACFLSTSGHQQPWYRQI